MLSSVLLSHEESRRKSAAISGSKYVVNCGRATPLGLPLTQDAEICAQAYATDFLPFSIPDSSGFRDTKFYPFIEHYNYYVWETAVGPVCVSMRKTDGYILLLVRTPLGMEYLRVSADSVASPTVIDRLLRRRRHPDVRGVLKTINHPLSSASFVLLEKANLPSRLMKLHERIIIKQHKVGVVFAAHGIVDFDQMLSTDYG